MDDITVTPASQRLSRLYLGLILVIMYVPLFVVALASISRSRFFVFPIRRTSLTWYEQAFASFQIQSSFWTSLAVAAWVAGVAVLLAFFGALAYARYDWTGKKLYQQLILIPIFFPQAVLGLALQLWFNSLGCRCPGRPRSSPSWSGSRRS
jgi:spermidine/putrescine transport system permease protein